MLYFDCGITSLLCRPPFMQSRVAISSYKLLYNQFLSSRLAYYRIVECKCLNSFLYEDTKVVGSKLVVNVFFLCNFFLFVYISLNFQVKFFRNDTARLLSILYTMNFTPNKSVQPFFRSRVVKENSPFD
jgi:hypothetical protein